MENFICYWYDGFEFRCNYVTVEWRDDKPFPIGLPADAQVNLLIEYEGRNRPTFYDEDGNEVGVETLE